MNENGKEIKWKIQYQDQMEFGQLQEGMTFGGRALVPVEMYKNLKVGAFGQQAVEPRFLKGTSKEEIIKYKAKIEGKEIDPEAHLMKSLMSVVADSATVEIWTLSKQALSTSMVESSFKIDEGTHKQIMEQIVHCEDPDRGKFHEAEVAFLRHQFEKWDRFKQEAVENIFIERN